MAAAHQFLQLLHLGHRWSPPRQAFAMRAYKISNDTGVQRISLVA
jgi:hypothetical protein